MANRAFADCLHGRVGDRPGYDVEPAWRRIPERISFHRSLPMYLWNADRLALALRAGRLTEAEKARYYAAGTLLGALSTRPGLAAWGTTEGAVRAAALLAIMLAGITLCYHANRRGDGRAFVERIVCLTVPCTFAGCFCTTAPGSPWR